MDLRELLEKLSLCDPILRPRIFWYTTYCHAFGGALREGSRNRPQQIFQISRTIASSPFVAGRTIHFDMSGRLDHTGLVSPFSFWRAGQNGTPKRAVGFTWQLVRNYARLTHSERTESFRANALIVLGTQQLKATKPTTKLPSLYRRRIFEFPTRPALGVSRARHF